jgi:predicted nucleotidyltransferase
MSLLPDAGRLASIEAALSAIEREEGVRIVLAVESGSRAWGFPSPDSDWDVRFIYARPADWFVSLDSGRDVIERMAWGGDPLLDVAGWDMRKTLNLAAKGNSVVREWLESPIIYRQDPGMLAELRAVIALAPRPAASARHYASLARQITGKYLSGDTVNLKKYFYAIRPALRLRWLRDFGELPPMDMRRLMAVARDPAERRMIEELMERKSRASEVGTGPRLPLADAMIGGMIQWADARPKDDLPAETVREAHDAALRLLGRSAAWAAT